MNHWIAVASAEHVRRGRTGGFMQVCHGKAAPLRRLRPGDGIVYYSPTEVFRGKDPLKAFTAIGSLEGAEPYQVAMAPDFRPFRRDVAWWPGKEAPIRPLLPILSFSAGNPGWGYQLRLGLFRITAADFSAIAAAMGLDLEDGLDPEADAGRSQARTRFASTISRQMRVGVTQASGAL